MTDTPVIRTSGLRKRYGTVEALRGLDLEVPPGSIFGLLGRNGAGKTTTMKVLLGIARPDSGTAEVFGIPASDRQRGIGIRRRSALMSEERDLIDSMSVGAMIRLTAGLYPRWSRDLEERHLGDSGLSRTAKVGALSRGMRTKLALLLALCRGAELLMLDEPTAGLDPLAAEEVLRALVAHASVQQGTVFFASHQISEVEQIADHVAILDRGRVILAGELDVLRANCRQIRAVFEGDVPSLPFEQATVLCEYREGRTLQLIVRTGSEAIVERLRAHEPAAIDVAPISLKQLFLETIAREESDRALG